MHLSLPRCMETLMLLTVYVYGTACYAGQQSSSLEQSICGIKEPFVFWLWSSAAGEASAARLTRVADVEDVAITSSDGRILRGYKLKATHDQAIKDLPRGYLLVVQGIAGAGTRPRYNGAPGPPGAIPSWTAIPSDGWKPCAGSCYRSNHRHTPSNSHSVSLTMSCNCLFSFTYCRWRTLQFVVLRITVQD